MRRLAPLLLAAAVLAGCGDPPRMPVDDASSRYDRHFAKHSQRHFGPGWDWRWWKSQAMAESDLTPDAVSHAGARGLMQIMPATLEEIGARSGIPVHRRAVKWHIAAGVWYDRWIWDQLTGADRLQLTFAAYNAGIGRIGRDMDACDCDRWSGGVAPLAPAETRAYVARIYALMGQDA